MANEKKIESVEIEVKEKVSAVEVHVPDPIATPLPLKLIPSTIVSYKLNLHKSNGQLRTDINKAVYTEMSRKWGDIMSIMSANKFQTLDEVCIQIWDRERRTYRRGHDRTRKQIEECMVDLTGAGFLLSRCS